MKLYSLPIDLEIVSSLDKDESYLDMSDLQFPIEDIDKKIRAAFVFLRNTSIDMKLSFAGCSYEMKKKYVMFYYQNNISVYQPSFDYTWLYILFERNGIDVFDSEKSILNRDEIRQFLEEESSYIDKLNNFVASIPLISMKYYSDKSGNTINMNEFQEDDSSFDINIENFANIFKCEEYLLLMRYDENVQPTYYTRYFDDPRLQNYVLKNMPDLNLFNILMNGERLQNFFLGFLDEIVKGENGDAVEESDN